MPHKPEPQKPEWISHYHCFRVGSDIRCVPVARKREWAGNASMQQKRREGSN